MRRDEFDRYYERYAEVIAAIARKLGFSDDELVADLEQEGLMALWRLQPARSTSNPDSMIRQAIKFRMIDYLRREKPHMYVSLDRLVEAGCQLEDDGEMHLRYPMRTGEEDGEE